MQSLYAMEQTKSTDLDKEKKFLNYSMEQMYTLFLINLQLLVEIRKEAADYMAKSQKKHLATQEEKNPNARFVSNSVLLILEDNSMLKDFAEVSANARSKRTKNPWELDGEYVSIIRKDILNSELYAAYMSTTEHSFKEDRNFLIELYKQVIAPNEKLYEYYEDQNLTWVDDLPIINTAIIKFLKKIKPTADKTLRLPSLYKDIDDKDFAFELFDKTALNLDIFGQEIEGKTPNWDKDRIADLDKTAIKMAICEFLKFPSIPVKVTINEYLEIVKEYSTPKSSVFVNGILDKLSKEYVKSERLQKVGRGLL